MQLIRDNLTLWTSELEEDGDKWEWSFRHIYKAIYHRILKLSIWKSRN
jgi:hypothetical protein